MNSHINQTMIEGLLSVGLGRKPEVHWEPISNRVEPVLNALSDRRIALPQLQGGETENRLLSRTGLGLLATNVAAIPNFDSAWPEQEGMQRLATVAMELGAVGAKVVTNFFFCERYIQSFVEELEMRMLVSMAEQAPESKIEVSPLELVFFAAMHHALMRSASADGELSRTVIDVLNGLRTEETSQLLMCLDDGLPQCKNSEDYANLARRLFPESQSGEQSDASQKQGQKQQGLGSGQAPQNAQDPGQPSGSDNGQAGQDSGGAQAPGECNSAATSGSQAVNSQPLKGAQASSESPDSGKGQGGEDSSGAQASGESNSADMSDGQAGHGPSDSANQDNADKATSDAQPANSAETVDSKACSANGEAAKEGEPASDSAKSAVIGQLALDGQQDQECAQATGQSQADPSALQQEGFAVASSDAQAADGTIDSDATSWFLGGDSLIARRDDMCEVGTVCDGRLVSTLLRVFQDKKPKSNGYVPAGPRVAANRMWRLKHLGDVAVFRKPQPRSGIDISVQILLDTSASMAKSLKCASDVTIALAEAMARTSGAKCSLAVFPAAGAYTQTILPFGGQVSKARRTMQTVRAAGGTPLGPAMADVIPYLERQRTMRKLLLVITDGEPGNSCEVLNQMKRAQERDIEVIGIGIGEQLEGQLKRLIPRSAVVKTVHDLAPALEQVFRDER